MGAGAARQDERRAPPLPHGSGRLPPSAATAQFMPTARSLPYAAVGMWVVKMCWIGERPPGACSAQRAGRLGSAGAAHSRPCRLLTPAPPVAACCCCHSCFSCRAGPHRHHRHHHAGRAAGAHPPLHPLLRLCLLQRPDRHAGGPTAGVAAAAMAAQHPAMAVKQQRQRSLADGLAQWRERPSRLGFCKRPASALR